MTGMGPAERSASHQRARGHIRSLVAPRVLFSVSLPEDGLFPVSRQTEPRFAHLRQGPRTGYWPEGNAEYPLASYEGCLAAVLSCHKERKQCQL